MQVFVEGLPELFAPFGSLCLVKAELLCAQEDRCVLMAAVMMMVVAIRIVSLHNVRVHESIEYWKGVREAGPEGLG